MYRVFAAALMLITSCSLARVPIVSESRDADVSAMDAGPAADVSIERPDVPEQLPDTPACGPCGPEERCDASGACTCAPDLCVDGRECIDSGCQPCGAVGSQCCPRAGCDMGSSCDSTGMCVVVPSCATVGAACCEGSRCDGGLSCVAGSCVAPCGNDGQACCPEDACNSDRLSCQDPAIGDRACRPCGFWGQPCCAAGACYGGSSCRALPVVGMTCSA